MTTQDGRRLTAATRWLHTLASRVPSGIAARVVVAGLTLAIFLIATAWLVQPAPQVDDTYLRFLALNTVCQLLLWGGSYSSPAAS